MAVIDSDADTDLYYMIFVRQRNAFRYLLNDLAGNLTGIFLIVGILDKNDEFISAKTADDAAAGEFAAKITAELDDDAVSDVMAVKIVYGFPI